MKTKKAAGQGGQCDVWYRITYPKQASKSMLKLAIGELLLFGDKQRRELWDMFEALLIDFYSESQQSPPQSHLTRPGWTNAGQRVDR